ncbi:MAG: hypothetical protein AAFX87_07120 [Bacteroidota bacterium]
MQNDIFTFESSPLFIIFCVILGVGYAFLLYTKKGPWGKSTRYVLSGLRFLLVSFLAILLLSPILKQIENTIEKPTIIIAVDNSSSVAQVLDSTQLEEISTKIKTLESSLKQADYELEYRDLNGVKPDATFVPQDFSAQETNLGELLKSVQNEYEGRNLAGVIMLSDGIYNTGSSPVYSSFNFPVYTSGVGDTIPKSDLSLKNLLYNKISYQGNKFPLIAEIFNEGFVGETLNVSVRKGGELLDTKSVTLARDKQLTRLEFTLEAESSGLQRYQVEVSRKNGEFTYDNNIKQAYIDIVEGKEKILLIAPSPHPDIKAIKSAIETNSNYEFDMYIPGVSKREDEPSNVKDYDLVIFHQVPDRRSVTQSLMRKFNQEGTSTLILMGNETNIRAFNATNGLLRIDALPNEVDNITAVFNNGFSSFDLSNDLQESFVEFPPLTVPFGRINLVEGVDVLLYQRVGSIETKKPLLLVKSSAEGKRAVMMGEGIWRWRLNEYARTDDNKHFNELMVKIVQYLSSKEDKRKFKVYPVDDEFFDNEGVVFDSEVYNDLYERVYGNKIDLTITPEEGQSQNYSFVTSESNTRYRISGLQEGVYKFSASSEINGQIERVGGEFLVKKQQLESVNLTADFDLLRRLSDNSGGKFYPFEQLQDINQELTTKEAKGIIHSSENYLPLVNLKWIFFLLLGLISAEWFIRKFSGAY